MSSGTPKIARNLPWSPGSSRVGTEPIGLAIDRARHTTYVSNFQDDTVSFFRTP